VALAGREVLRHVSLAVHAGEVLALVGPNGAGKSTLLNAMAGDLPLSSGEIQVDGEPLAHWTHMELALRRAVLPQQVAVAFPFPVDEVVRMGRAPWQRTAERALDDAAVAGAIVQADVGHLVGRLFPTLSGGERARVALARVLAQRTQLLLLDEPTAALDLHHQELVLRVVRECVAAGGAAVVVLHDLSLAAAYADRVAVLAGGQLVADGPPSEVFTEFLLSAVYQHPIEVIPHPHYQAPLVVPRRTAAAEAALSVPTPVSESAVTTLRSTC
jgi:iron complex transport system ATP-binding protein